VLFAGDNVQACRYIEVTVIGKEVTIAIRRLPCCFRIRL